MFKKKKNAAKIILAVILILSLAVTASSCAKADGDDAVTTGGGTITTEAPPATEAQTDDALPVGYDPTTAASRGMNYLSNGDGTSTLIGIGSCTDTCIIIPDKSDNGEPVTKIAASAFLGNTTITAVQIPAGVLEIGAGAFAGCTKLAYISVANGNKNYIDAGGVLFSADGSKLICLPAGAAYITLTITTQVTSIADYATDGCISLKKVLYEGTKDEWKLVKIGSGNSILTAAEVTCAAQTGK